MNEQNTSQSSRSIELCKRVVTTESFIAEAKEIYGNRYLYDKVNYINCEQKVIVTCRIHGDFEVYARNHLDGKGCPKCRRGEKYITKLHEKFGDKFDLKEFVYEDYQSPVTIICPIHGEFSKLPSQILKSECGCPLCDIDAIVLPNSFVGIDFETLYSQRVSACSIGMVKYIDGVIVDRYYSLIRPPFDYPGKCGDILTWVHGITERMVKNERTFKELLPEIERFVDGLPLVAHNASVERGCIRDASAFYGIETTLDFENIYDTRQLSKLAETKLGTPKKELLSHQLDDVCERFGVSANNHHNALADAEMCGNLMIAFQKIIGKSAASTL